MRTRTWVTLIFIVLLALVSAWIALPGDALDLGGFRAQHPVRRGLDLQGGLQVVLQAQPVAGQELDAETLEGTKATLERRVNGLGVSEPIIQTRGNDQIIVELPGIANPQQAVEILRETALLEIIDPQGQPLDDGTIVNTTLGSAAERLNPAASPAAATPVAPGATPVATPVATPTVEPVVAASDTVYTTIISGNELEDAFVTTDNTGVTLVVGFRLNGEGARKFQEFTSANIGQPMSIVVDKRVISSPIVQAAISDQGIITGVPPAEVTDLVIQLKAGALAVPLEVVQSRTVGPTLGQDSLDRSIIAGLIGLGTVGLFMILYYRVPGALAVVALLIYTAIVFAIFKLIPVTLTLAGIAGFILSIGMAVDANVLIFARMKEELRLGRPLSNAIEAGFDHAWPSIRDSNISTMITTFILYLFGSYTGTTIITGFAITLLIGVVVSMFTAIIVTRNLLRLLVELGLGRGRWLFGIGT